MAENLVICIARQFGSGGRDIGKAVAGQLGIGFYDKELLNEAAKKSGILEELFEKADERPTTSMMYTLSALGMGTTVSSFEDFSAYMPNDKIQNIIADVIREKAAAGPCVIIGRCADYILRGERNMLSVFVHAPLDVRIQRVARRHNCDEDHARSLIRKTDRSRANYYSFYTDREWGDVDNFHIAVDSGRLGIDKAATFISKAAEVFTNQQ